LRTDKRTKTENREPANGAKLKDVTHAAFAEMATRQGRRVMAALGKMAMPRRRRAIAMRQTIALLVSPY